MKKGFITIILTGILAVILNNPASAADFSQIGNTAHYKKFNAAVSVDSKKINNIIYPLLSTPAIIQQDSALVIQIDTRGITPESVNIYLKNTENSPLKGKYPLSLQSIAKGDSSWYSSGTIYNISVLIPESVKENLYDLSVSCSDAAGRTVSDTQPHSVKVINNFKANFTIVHLTDLHVGSPRNISDLKNAAEAGYWSPEISKRWLYLQKTINEVNLLNPDFVVISGDLMFGQLNPLEYVYEYEETYRMLKLFKVPVYLVPGNHDYYAQDGTLTDGAKFWRNYFGPAYYSFNYGNYAHVLGINTYDWHISDRSAFGLSASTWGGQIKPLQLDWIYKDLLANSADASSARQLILFSHHNPLFHDNDTWPGSDLFVKGYWRGYDKQNDPQRKEVLLLGETLGFRYDQLWHGEGSNELIDMAGEFSFKLGLHGHTHEAQTDSSGGAEYIITPSLELGGKPYSGYRFITHEGEGRFSYLNENNGSFIPIYKDGNIPAGIMSFYVTYAGSNDGTEAYQQAQITNSLSTPLTLFIPFYMKEGNYTASEGEIVVEQEINGIKYILLKIDLPANSTEPVSLK